MALSYYDYLITGLSTDTKPVLHPNTGAGLSAGWFFVETNTSKQFLYDGVAWKESFGVNIPAMNHNFGAFFIDIAQIASPSSPSSGVRRIFVDSSDGKLKVRNSGAVNISLEEQGSTPTFIGVAKWQDF